MKSAVIKNPKGVERGYCWCGCGEQTPIATRTDKSKNLVRGEPTRFIRGHQARTQTGEANSNWKGGKFMKDGFIYVRMPHHPMANKLGYVPQHRLVAAEKYGADALKGKRIWWIDQNRSNNAPDNIILVTPKEYLNLLAQATRPGH